MQLANECDCRDILTTIKNLDKFGLKVADVGLESVTRLNIRLGP